MTRKAKFVVEAQQEQKEPQGRLVTTEPMRNIRATMVYGKGAIDNLTTRRAMGNKTVLNFDITYTDTETGRKKPKVMSLIFPTAGLKNDNATMIKVFSIITGKIAEVPFNPDGTPQETRFTFSINDLQALCGVRSPDTIYDAIHKLIAFIDEMGIVFNDKGNTLKTLEHEFPIPIFRRLTLKDAVLTVTLGKDDKTGILYNYNTIFPLALYSLNNSHLYIAQHILTMARQQAQRASLKKRGYFKVTIQDIIKAANLPIHDEKKASERVRGAILQALENMKDMYPKYTETDAHGNKRQVYCFDYAIKNPTTKRSVEAQDTLFDDDATTTTKSQPMREWVKNEIWIYFRGETLNFYTCINKKQLQKIKDNSK